jgi:hypothetical protein
MTRKQLAILICLLIAIGGIGLLLRHSQNAAWSSARPEMGKKLLSGFDVNSVARIAISHDTNSLTLEKKDDLWRVKERNDYPANFSQITDFLIKAADLKIVQVSQVGPSQLPRLDLAPGQGTNSPVMVEFKDQSGKTLKSLVLGKKHVRKSDRPSPFGDMGDEGFPDGRYVQAGTGSDMVALVGDAMATIEPKAESWLNKDFFKVERVRSVGVSYPSETNSWRISRETETGEWKLADPKPGEQLDAVKAGSTANPFSFPNFADVAVNAKPEELGLDKPTVIALSTFDDFNYNIKVGQKTGENYPVTISVAAELAKERTPGKDEKPEDKDKLDKEFKEKQKKLEEKLTQEKGLEKWTYLVSNWTLEPALKTRAQLMAEKKEEKPATADKDAKATDIEPKLPDPTVPPAETKPDKP